MQNLCSCIPDRPIPESGCLSEDFRNSGNSSYPKDFILACFGATGLDGSGAPCVEIIRRMRVFIHFGSKEELCLDIEDKCNLNVISGDGAFIVHVSET